MSSCPTSPPTRLRVHRAADVILKERRRLVLMVRETPLHKGHLELMSRAADYGAVILPPMPAFYHHPQTIQDLIHQSIGKALDQLVEPRLVDRHLAAPQRSDLRLVLIDADHLMAEIGEASA